MYNIRKETLAARARRLSSSYVIVKPDGLGPFPTIIMVHGCGRADRPQEEYAKAAQKEGFASIILDSFAPRNINRLEAATSVCTGVQLWGRERAGDIVAALNWAEAQEWADMENIHALGWSHGGWTIMDALALENKIGEYAKISDCPEAPFAKLKSAFLIYPWCGPASFSFMRGWQRKIPAHTIICGKDAVVGEVLPRATFKKLIENGENIEVTYFENGSHSFDEIDGVHPAQKYDAELTAKAVALFVDFVKANNTKT